ncbi:XPG domain containing-domain-containing protein [Xylariaceae sp. FL0804]|nr:XPG domain containing-domain-containing protein [Xylariaceae sp. FL0804]
MGIRGLALAVSRYGAFSSLTGDTVVIDGPALVHRIAEECSQYALMKGDFIRLPPYSVLGRQLIAWLDDLRAHHVHVRRIYFDGYLPPSKFEVRRGRLLEQSQSMKSLVRSHPSGSARLPEHAFADFESVVPSIQQPQSFYKRAPKPPFMIPAAIEALRSHKYWGKLVRVVPGEADVFCAEDVLQGGGTVLTTDSDLLTYDLGPNGAVAFLWDVVPADPDTSLGLRARKMSVRDMNDRLQVDAYDGLSRIAYDMEHGNLNFNAALLRARRENGDIVRSTEIRAYMEERQHLTRNFLPRDHYILDVLSTLDPRISELVIQTLLARDQEAVRTPKTLRGPKALSFFLPTMVEDRNRQSAWTASTEVRQVGYGILQDCAHSRPPYHSAKLIEYRVLDASKEESRAAGTQIVIPDITETTRRCELLLDTLEKIEVRQLPESMHWFAFAMYQEIEWCLSEEKEPLSIALIDKTIGQSKPAEKYSWDLIHFTALIQASFYSLRFLKQILGIAAFLNRDLSSPMARMRECLASLPPISEWPTLDGISGLLCEFARVKGHLAIAEMLEVELSELRQVPAKADKLPLQMPDPGSSKQSASNNPFAILEQMPQN